MSAPEVSVVMPLYNKEREVMRAVGSVLGQERGRFELLVVDDGSTDRGPDLVRGLNDPRIRVVSQERAGVSAARNRGVAACRADLVAFLDGDDEWTADFLGTVLRLRAAHPACAVFATNYVLEHLGGAREATVLRGVPPAPWEGVLTDYFAVAAASSPPFSSSSVAVTKTALGAVGGFPAGVAVGEDLLTWARVAVRFQIAYANRVCAVFHRGHHDPVVHARPPDREDPVGRGLRALLADHGGESLRRYVARWHRMRASIYLQMGLPREARAEIAHWRNLAGRGPAETCYRFIARLPGWAARRVFGAFQRGSRRSFRG